ncbi:carbamoyltransferase family protein [Micromonospora inyonensis]|uniref:Carbamoyltransferase n=1 Tax=Micromonospora inyonensis TaxID=47866 RepID=A0A1C6S791_9ACTN|nr:carbamoyltransferase C-terminal domain-containing protein [Micromonospora inyonensis]SCL25337.1 carbamoyltransferase [Micromonospora inyonensis]
MRVLGVSGLPNSQPFKRRELPGLAERDYRIVQGLDSAAAIVTDAGVVAAAAEERFTGVKATGELPVNAIRYCLREAGLTFDDLDSVAHGFHYASSPVHAANPYFRRRHDQAYAPEAMKDRLRRHFPDADWDRLFVPVRHHLAHAASAYHLSGFDRALVLVADGMGEAESMTVLTGEGPDLRPLAVVPAPHSLGTLYGAVTLHLGFEFNMDEYKVMGLAPYGDAGRFRSVFDQLVRLRDDGTYSVPVLGENRGWQEFETLAGTRRKLVELFGPAREPGEPLTGTHMDIAATAQAVVEHALLHTLRHFATTTGERRLCYAGGVALNCTVNGVASRSGLFDDIFVQPAAGDDGSALGAALAVHPARPFPRMSMPYWGPSYGGAECGAAIAQTTGIAVETYDDEDKLLDDIAHLLTEQNFVGWFTGRMEFGPRALGHRSILADPRDAGVRDRLNAVVKQREDFRPFAPVVREEDADTYFEVGDGVERYRHMLFVTHTRSAYREPLAAVTHVDGTARVQVLRRADNPRLWRLLGRFGELTGLPVLLNTSLNLRGQPIIRDPRTALDTFVRSRLDRLVLENAVVRHEGRPS